MGLSLLKDSAEREVITISEDLAGVEKARQEPEQAYKFPRAWVMIDWIESPIRGQPSRLALRLHGKEVEIGRFWVESERRALAREPKALLSSK